MITCRLARSIRSATVGRKVSRFFATSSLRFQNVPASVESLDDDEGNKVARTTENDFLHGVLRNSKRYNLNFIRETHDKIVADSAGTEGQFEWKSLSDDRLCREFAKVCMEAYKNGDVMSDDKYVQMFTTLNERVAKMSDEEMKNILVSLVLWRSICSSYQPEFYVLANAIDKALVPKVNLLSAEKTLEIFEVLYQLRLLKTSDFVYNATKRLSRRVRKLTSEQLVLFLFYLNSLRMAKKYVEFLDIEEKLSRVVNKLTIEEIGVACAGFFKTESYLHYPELIDAIVTKMIQNADTAPEITLVCIMKALRYKLPTKLWHRLPEMIDALAPQIDRLSMQGAIHVPLILSSSLTRNEKALDKIANKLLVEIDSARLKDLEKVVYPLVLMNYDPKTPKCIFREVGQQLDRKERMYEIANFPKSYIAIVHYFVLKGIFLANHINRILSIEYLHAVYGKTNYSLGREALFIDASVELECPDYTGNRLPPDVRAYMAKRYCSFIPDRNKKLTFHQKFEVEVMDTLKRLTGDQYSTMYLLPNHPRADHVVRWDSKNDFSPLPDDFAATEPFAGLVRSPGPDYVAVVPVTRNMFLKNGNDELMGECVVKIRQLKALGYRPVVVSQTEWPMEATDLQKEDYLVSLIKSSSLQL
ncbi:FAST kinase domains 5 [Nesidiocoris tenuis]|uniref:FAST kinase domains 5 n=1 Tax=Nesidiocoris tenuis TaxID=355587 RepID=A0ABN7BCB5_9HEMI|nr:FAST kinase domains 5 [Nesidiocoris tenuis]